MSDRSREESTRSYRVDTKEFEFPETLLISDIDPKVFQAIVFQCLSNIEGISLTEGGFIDNILGRTGPEVGSSGIVSQQDTKAHSVSIKIELNIRYGLSIPEKAEEVQAKVVEEITKLTGLRVSSVHVIFKNLIAPDAKTRMMDTLQLLNKKASEAESFSTTEYDEEF